MLEALQARGQEFLRRTFDVRVGEYRRVLLMQLNIFLIILCLWIIKPVVNAQFLATAGIERLPWVFLMVAVTALLVSSVYARLLNRMPLGSMIRRTYLTAFVGIMAMAVLLHLGLFAKGLVYLFYIGVALFGLLTTSQFWILANVVFRADEAKRLFGFIGAGAIAGGISGGYITSLLAPAMSSENLLFVAAGLILVALRVNRRIWKTQVPVFSPEHRAAQTRDIAEHPLRLIRRSSLLTYLALIMGVSVVVAKLVEFQFSAIASARIPDPDRLASFFGFWFSTFNVVSLVIQLFITQRVVGVFGVGRSLFILPGALLTGALGVMFAPVIAMSIILKLFDISLKQSINKAATELLILPLPLKVKSQAKTFIDVFVDTTATGVGGILLIFLVSAFELSIQAVCLLIVLLVIIWMFYALRIRREYLLTFQHALGLPPERPRKESFALSTVSAVQRIRQALAEGSEKQLLFLLEKVEETRDQRLIPDTLPLLDHPSAAVRQAALRCLYYSPDHSLVSNIEPLLKDPDPEVRYRAFAALLAHSRQHRVRIINAYLADPDPVVSGAALVGLAMEARYNPELKALYRIEERVEERLSRLGDQPDPSARLIVIRAIGYGALDRFFPVLEQWIRDRDFPQSAEAIHALGRAGNPSLIPFLAGRLVSRRTRPHAAEALAAFPTSLLVPALEALARDPEQALDFLLRLPDLLQSLESQRAADLLLHLAGHPDAALRREALSGLAGMHRLWPHLRMRREILDTLIRREARIAAETHQLLKALGTNDETGPETLGPLLMRRLVQSLDHLARLLALYFPAFAILPVFDRLRQGDARSRANALEFLDNVLRPEQKPLILPLLQESVEPPLSYTPAEEANHDTTPAIRQAFRQATADWKLSLLHRLAPLPGSLASQLLQLAETDPDPRVSQLALRLRQHRTAEG
jgi:ATP:ADP antiporter, AAA family